MTLSGAQSSCWVQREHPASILVSNQSHVERKTYLARRLLTIQTWTLGRQTQTFAGSISSMFTQGDRTQHLRMLAIENARHHLPIFTSLRRLEHKVWPSQDVYTRTRILHDQSETS